MFYALHRKVNLIGPELTFKLVPIKGVNMKPVCVLVLSFIFSVQFSSKVLASSSNLSLLVTSADSISSGRYMNCSIVSNELKCWKGPNFVKAPAFVNPVQVSVGFESACALGDGAVKCWGSNSDGQTVVPKLKKPRQVSVGYKHACALDDEGVKCWGDESYYEDMPALVSPRKIDAKFGNTCAIDDEGVKCWSRFGSWTLSEDPKSITDVKVGNVYGCIKQEDTVTCYAPVSYTHLTLPTICSV